jgi:hypothetical protein
MLHPRSRALQRTGDLITLCPSAIVTALPEPLTRLHIEHKQMKVKEK